MIPISLTHSTRGECAMRVALSINRVIGQCPGRRDRPPTLDVHWPRRFYPKRYSAAFECQRGNYHIIADGYAFLVLSTEHEHGSLLENWIRRPALARRLDWMPVPF